LFLRDRGEDAGELVGFVNQSIARRWREVPSIRYQVPRISIPSVILFFHNGREDTSELIGFIDQSIHFFGEGCIHIFGK
jgi:hypothetical protein